MTNNLYRWLKAQPDHTHGLFIVYNRHSHMYGWIDSLLGPRSRNNTMGGRRDARTTAIVGQQREIVLATSPVPSLR